MPEEPLSFLQELGEFGKSLLTLVPNIVGGALEGVSATTGQLGDVFSFGQTRPVAAAVPAVQPTPVGANGAAGFVLTPQILLIGGAVLVGVLLLRK